MKVTTVLMSKSRHYACLVSLFSIKWVNLDNKLIIHKNMSCLAANIADGFTAKDFIMTNEDVLKKITSYLVCTHTSRQTCGTDRFFCLNFHFICIYLLNFSIQNHASPKLQTAAVLCVSNLAWKDEEGSVERQTKLKELGVQKLLHSLITTSDQNLFDRYVRLLFFLSFYYIYRVRLTTNNLLFQGQNSP